MLAICWKLHCVYMCVCVWGGGGGGGGGVGVCVCQEHWQGLSKRTAHSLLGNANRSVFSKLKHIVVSWCWGVTPSITDCSSKSLCFPQTSYSDTWWGWHSHCWHFTFGRLHSDSTRKSEMKTKVAAIHTKNIQLHCQCHILELLISSFHYWKLKSMTFSFCTQLAV